LHYINDPVLKDFLKKVLQKQPTERLGFKDAKQIKKTSVDERYSLGKVSEEIN
jgi:hypothetical protein